MKFSHFFIDRPVFAAVVSVLITILGALAYPLLPVAQYPEIAPPTVTVTTSYPGASAETIAEAVATPIELQINGVENMLYMSSQSTGDGNLTITVTFKLGADLNAAQVLVENRVQVAEPRLPTEVRNIGVTVRKATPDILIGLNFYSPDGSLDAKYISNYVTLNIKDRLLRLKGIGDITIRGERDYSMRIWIDPDKAAARSLTVDDINNALASHNVQVAAGVLNQPPFGAAGPANQLSLQALGRLTTPEQFRNIIVKTDPNGEVTRISDVARVELGAQDYTSAAGMGLRPAVLMGVLQLPGSNAIETDRDVHALMAEAAKKFPPGLAYEVILDPTEYTAETVKEVNRTLFIALVLVAIVVLVFLQSWRAALIPILAIPVSLIGTFAVMKVGGFSLNNLSMFGLVLAIGIVVDDAIVVVENVERHLAEGATPSEAAHKTMDEVGGALIAIALVLVGVFVPAALITGITGQFYRQFALTIATATLISLIVSLTLSPALAALLLKPKTEHGEGPAWLRPVKIAGERFNKSFDWLSHTYGRFTGRVVRMLVLVLPIYAILLGLTVWRGMATPTGFIPDQDQGFFYLAVQLPTGASLDRAQAMYEQVVKAAEGAPGVDLVAGAIGVDPTTNTTNSSWDQMFIVESPFAERVKKHLPRAAIIADLQKRFAKIQGAMVRVIPPPPVRGIGAAGGFKMIVEDQNKVGYAALESAAGQLAASASADPAIGTAFNSFNTKTPRLFVDIDRDKAEKLGVPDANVFSTLQTYLGSNYVNDFNYLGYTYQVRTQADWDRRAQEADVGTLKTRAANGDMAPLGAFVTLKRTTGPYRVLRYNLYPAAEVQGGAAAGKSSGQALKAMDRLAAQLPAGFAAEWTELAYQQQLAGNTGAVVFVLAVVFAFLLLAALYESVTLPLAVVLIVPMCILAALVGVALRGMDNNILTQVGLIVLVGLAAKNAILIVEFAKQGEEDHGLDRWQAAIEAARTRLRPILMTSAAFILGVAPLAFATGAGSEMRQALGVAVFSGMIGVTVFGLAFTPAFYVVFRWVADRLPKPKAKRTGAAPAAASPTRPEVGA